MSTFTTLPAIDLRGGRVVRLRRGDFATETTYADGPSALARSIAEAGARWLHVVDLDGARAGEPRNMPVVAEIVAAVAETTRPAGGPVQIEVGGGVRTIEVARSLLSVGVARVVLGTASVREAGTVRQFVEELGPERVAAAIDVRDGLALGDGWRSGATGVPPAELVRSLHDIGVRTFEVTAIDRDGSLEGPDLELLASVVFEAGAGPDAGAPPATGVIASGGIRSIEDLQAVRSIGCRGAIVGRALLEGRLGLSAALDAGRDP